MVITYWFKVQEKHWIPKYSHTLSALNTIHNGAANDFLEILCKKVFLDKKSFVFLYLVQTDLIKAKCKGQGPLKQSIKRLFTKF